VTDVTRITSADDPRLADYRSLTDVALRRKIEPENGLFIAEGEKVVRRALAAGYEMRSLLCAESRAPDLADLPGRHLVADYDVLAAVTGFHVHRGVLAAMARRPLATVDEVQRCAHRLMVLEELSSTTNLGAVFRSAAGLGIDGIILAPTCGDPLYRRAVRVSMGQVFAIPYARCERWPEPITQLRDEGWRVLALTPDARAHDIDTLQAGPEERLALLIGAEGSGLSAQALEAAGEWVRIPMSAGVDSLNVAAAAAVAAYALRR
jgi:tRNA G18 (ribose-2'-O)-methylase SpoU